MLTFSILTVVTVVLWLMGLLFESGYYSAFRKKKMYVFKRESWISYIVYCAIIFGDACGLIPPQVLIAITIITAITTFIAFARLFVYCLAADRREKMHKTEKEQ